MPDYSESVGIMYPAEFSTMWLGGDNLPEDLHTTIMYLGEFSTIDYEKEDVLIALAGIDLNMFIWAEIVGRELFGAEQDIPVLLVGSEQVYRNHEIISATLAERGIFSQSAFTEYKPHITVDMDTWNAPPQNALLRPAQLWWGLERINL